MTLEGLWENIETAALLKIVYIPNSSDEYEWHYGFNGTEYTEFEQVLISFMEVDKTAYVRSKRFQSSYLLVENTDQFRIDNEVFTRLETNPFSEVKFLR